MTALLPADKMTACRRALFRLGAGRVVGLPPRVLFDRDGSSTFDVLCRQLEKPQPADPAAESDSGD